MTLEISIEVATPEVSDDELELADLILGGDPAADMAFDVLQQSVVDALTDAGVVMPSDVRPECLRDPIKRCVTGPDEELDSAPWLGHTVGGGLNGAGGVQVGRRGGFWRRTWESITSESTPIPDRGEWTITDEGVELVPKEDTTPIPGRGVWTITKDGLVLAPTDLNIINQYFTSI